MERIAKNEMNNQKNSLEGDLLLQVSAHHPLNGHTRTKRSSMVMLVCGSAVPIGIVHILGEFPGAGSGVSRCPEFGWDSAYSG